MRCLSLTLLHINIKVTLAVNNYLWQLSILSRLLMPEWKAPGYIAPTDDRFQGEGILLQTPIFSANPKFKTNKQKSLKRYRTKKLLQKQTVADLYKRHQQHDRKLKESMLTQPSLLKTCGFSSMETATNILLVNLMLNNKQLFPSYFRILGSLTQWQVWKPTQQGDSWAWFLWSLILCWHAAVFLVSSWLSVFKQLLLSFMEITKSGPY